MKDLKRWLTDFLVYWIPLIAITIIVIQLFQPLVARTILPWMGRNMNFDNLPLNIAYGVLLGIILIGAICRLFTKSNLKFSKIFSPGLVALFIVYGLYRCGGIPHPFWNFSYLFCSITYIDGVFLATALLYLTYPVISKYKAIRETKRTKKDGESPNNGTKEDGKKSNPCIDKGSESANNSTIKDGVNDSNKEDNISPNKGTKEDSKKANLSIDKGSESANNSTIKDDESENAKEDNKKVNKDDLEINAQEDDKFDFYNNALSLLTNLEDRNLDERALIVGLRGKWGEGKSSYLNAIKNIIEYKNIDQELTTKRKDKIKKDYRVVEFKPWYSTSSDQLTQDFFDSFYQEIEGKPLRVAFKRYARKVRGADAGWVSRFLNIFNTNSIETQYRNFKSLLKEQDCRYLVLVDDLDRLETDEIMRTIQLIRNIADFPNVIFIAAFDEDYVLERIKTRVGKNEEDALFYLQKTFTVPHYLPMKRHRDLIQVQKEMLNSILNIGEEDVESREYVQYFLEDIEKQLSFRDMVLIANTVNLALSRLKSQDLEVCLYDMLLVYYLQILNNELYNDLYEIVQDGKVKPEYATRLLKEIQPIQQEIINPIQNLEINNFVNFKTDHWAVFYYKKDMEEYQDNKNSSKPVEKPASIYLKSPKDFIDILSTKYNRNVNIAFKILTLLFVNPFDDKKDEKQIQGNNIFTTFRIKNPNVFPMYFEKKKSLSSDFISNKEFYEGTRSYKIYLDHLTEWEKDVNPVLLYQLNSKIEFDSQAHAEELFKAYLEFNVKNTSIEKRIKNRISLIGVELFLREYKKKNNKYVDLYKEAFNNVFLTVGKEYDETNDVKVILISYLGQGQYYRSSILDLFVANNTDINNYESEFRAKLTSCLKEYLSSYLNHLDSYANFNYMYAGLPNIGMLGNENKQELRQILKDHIGTHQLDFIKTFGIEKFSDPESFLYPIFKNGFSTVYQGIEKFIDSFNEPEQKDEAFIKFKKEFEDTTKPTPPHISKREHQ